MNPENRWILFFVVISCFACPDGNPILTESTARKRKGKIESLEGKIRPLLRDPGHFEVEEFGPAGIQAIPAPGLLHGSRRD
jgi:hypothetical protein